MVFDHFDPRGRFISILVAHRCMTDQIDDSLLDENLGSDTPNFSSWDIKLEKFDYSLDYIVYPSVDDVVSIHDDIIEEDEDASRGILNDGHVDFALNYIQHGHYGEVPDSIHEKAYSLMKLLAANHAFADGNKRTALNSTWTFYAMNGYYFSYGEEIKAILKLLAVKQEMVDEEEVISYFEAIAFDEESEQAPTELIKLQHLFACSEETSQRINSFFNELKEGRATDPVTRIFELAEEAIHVTSGFVQYKNEYHDELSDSMMRFVDEMQDSTERLLGFMEDLSQIEPGPDEEGRERMNEIISDYDTDEE